MYKRQVLEIFEQVGLGYLTLGQPASTFSGGEAQRVRMATELSNTKPEHTLYILDEPTSGLHPADVVHLTSLLRKLVNAGHSVIVIEHNTDIMQSADHLIDIGPESASHGGRIVAEGSLQQIAQAAASHTGRLFATSSLPE